MRKLAMLAYSSPLLLLVLAVAVSGRLTPYAAPELVSDGITNHTQEEESSFLHLKGTDSAEEHCEQMYGFLPCSESPLGHIFLIVVYEYLLYHGESYVASGGKRIFKILGPGIFGASAFQVLGSLPESLILLASGLLNSKEMAEEYVLTGVGLLAGSTIFLLTVLWGTCIIIGSQRFPSSDPNNNSSSNSVPTQNRYLKFISRLNDYGVTTDPEETNFAARTMVLSIVPFIIILIPKFVGVSYSSQSYIFPVTLTVSVTFLLVYFIYQVFEPSIQKMRLEYVKHEHLVVDILKHLKENTMGKMLDLLNEFGAANIPAIKSLFEKIDQDGDNFISFVELRGLLQDINFRQLTWDKEKTIQEIMKELDLDADEKVDLDEFVKIITKWLDEAKSAVNKRYRSKRSLKDLYPIVHRYIQAEKKEQKMMNVLVPDIVRHVHKSRLGDLYMEDGSPDVSAIKRLFASIDLDNDNYVSQSELRQLIMNTNIENKPFDVDEAVARMMKDLDTSGDNRIDESEFITGFEQCLNTPNSPYHDQNADQQNIERWIDDEKVEVSIWAWAKAIMLLVLGIAMLAVLAEPLIHSVQKLSTSVNIPSFYISFIFVPLATNTRAAISAISMTSRKKRHTTSFTFSEIYDGVFMNNVLGFSVLLAVVYFRGLTWHFSAEVMVVLIVCAIVGFGASFRSQFPVWTSIFAYLLYPLSLIFVYVFDKFFWLS